MTQKLKFPDKISHPAPYRKEGDGIWLLSSLTLQRNLSRYKFPSKLSSNETQVVLDICRALIEKSPEMNGAIFFPAQQLDSFEKEFLFEHFLCSESFQNAGVGQGFLVEASGEFLALLNLKNHLQLHMLTFSNDLPKAWEELSKIENAFGKQMTFAFSSKFGYLTSDPTECGTALRIAIYLHLPALIHSHQLREALSKQKDEDLEAAGLEGSMDDFVGDVVILKNQYTLGLSEESLLHEMQTTALKLITSEKTIRSHLKENGNTEMKDLVGRAYGLLVHSYQLQTKEALSALSLIKLGIELGWIKGCETQKIDHAIFHCRRAHMAHAIDEAIENASELNCKRATFIHKALEGAILD